MAKGSDFSTYFSLLGRACSSANVLRRLDRSLAAIEDPGDRPVVEPFNEFRDDDLPLSPRQVLQADLELSTVEHLFHQALVRVERQLAAPSGLPRRDTERHNTYGACDQASSELPEVSQ